MFDALPHPLNFLVPFAIVLGVLVFVHELGHYLAARWRGVHVEAFSIGFGRSLASWRDRRGTQWKIGWIPLGGYVKLHGQELAEDAGTDVHGGRIAGRTYSEKSVGSRAIIIGAGPVANFLLAIVISTVLFASVGQPHMPAVIGKVLPDSAAERGGLQPGDRLLSVDGEPVSGFEDVQRLIGARPAQPVTLRVQRGDAEQTLNLTTGSRVQGSAPVGSLGVTNGPPEYRQLSLPAAFLAGTATTVEIAWKTLQGVGEMISGTRGTEELGGILRIAEFSGEAAKDGLANLVSFIAILSVNIGLLNLFPIPVLDGGHLVFLAAEWVRGRPLPPRAVEYGFRAGLAVIVGLFVFSAWNDLSHLGLLSWITRRMG